MNSSHGLTALHQSITGSTWQNAEFVGAVGVCAPHENVGVGAGSEASDSGDKRWSREAMRGKIGTAVGCGHFMIYEALGSIMRKTPLPTHQPAFSVILRVAGECDIGIAVSIEVTHEEIGKRQTERYR